MHGFRDRPLTWLLLSATICVDLVMVLPLLFLARHTFSYQEVDIYVCKWILSIGVPAQLSLAAIWAAISPIFRLTRGAVLTAAVYLAFLSAMLFGLSRQEVVLYFFAPTLVIWAVTLVLWLLGWLPGWRSRDADGNNTDLRILNQAGNITDSPSDENKGNEETPEPSRPWQFSLVELFGWTCIVALWAFAMHHANLVPYPWSWLIRAVTVPLLMVLLLGGPGSWPLRSGCVLAVSALILLVRGSLGLGTVGLISSIPAIYLALWYVVRRLDGALGTRV